MLFSRMFRIPVVGVVGVIALGLGMLVSAGGSTPVLAHQTSSQGNHFTWVIKVPAGPYYSVNVKDQASTSEYKSGSMMLMDSHANTGYVMNGWCRYQYPFCFSPVSSPKTVYSNDNGSYVMTNWDLETCFLPYKAHGRCWSSDTELAWFEWPVDADASRKIGMFHWPQYAWLSCYCSLKTFDTPSYEVD